MTEVERLERRLKERFVKAFATYHLLEDDDRVLVGLSGGKDSLLLTELLAKRSRIDYPRFQVEAIHVRMENICYETSTSYLEQFCSDLNVPLHTVTTHFDTANPHTAELPLTAASLRRQKQPCFLCSWNRRKQMFNLAQQLGCNKIALGHHRDDIIHTALMNLIYQGRFATMPTRLAMRKMPLTIIRPLCLIDQADISRYAELRGYEKQLKLCPYEHYSHRSDSAMLFDTIERMNPEARFSIWSALEAAEKLTEE